MTSPLLLLLVLTCTATTTTTLAQTTAPVPPPAGPTDITKILEKAGQYTILLNLLRMTQVDDQINNQLKKSYQGFTLFAPTDNAFSVLSLNSLSDQQKVQLMQFHVVPTYLSTSHFETVSNPVRTQAGETTYYKFPLNITTSGNQVNITTGVVNATVGNTIYTDGSLAVYQVDKVLLPMSMFGPPAPAAAPAPEPVKTKDKSNADAVTPSSQGGGTVSADASGAVGFRGHLHGLIMGAIVFIGMSCL